jgi:hypothetical protein
MKEAFVYLWFDTKTRMFYLGYHKGTPDDSYTHSSNVMESFTKTSIPSYMRRRILAMGTEQEMIELENKLLDNRKEKCWDKYYNVTVAFPPPPMYGEDHWNWKGGISLHPEYAREWREKNPEKKRELQREYYAKNTEKVRSCVREWREKNSEKVRSYDREWREKNSEKVRSYDRKYREKNAEKLREKKREYREKNAEKLREKRREYRAKNREKVREINREYYAKNLEKIREQQREYRAKKKRE